MKGFGLSAGRLAIRAVPLSTFGLSSFFVLRLSTFENHFRLSRLHGPARYLANCLKRSLRRLLVHKTIVRTRILSMLDFAGEAAQHGILLMGFSLVCQLFDAHQFRCCLVQTITKHLISSMLHRNGQDILRRDRKTLIHRKTKSHETHDESRNRRVQTDPFDFEQKRP
ncbi:hypothetical protein L596_002268 [Steinernema carpocapsae]|uniref:Uncharacterized protein n=1 Tax=Steinernema carpocapsae TaxID=34508 RepID=A0A4U8UP34_STECR|nr:hypothetical protein L596_002268 [Steinernema carpocapsae]